MRFAFSLSSLSWLAREALYLHTYYVCAWEVGGGRRRGGHVVGEYVRLHVIRYGMAPVTGGRARVPRLLSSASAGTAIDSGALGVGGARLEGWPPPFPDATAVRGESKNINHLDATVGDGDQGIQRVR